MWIQITNVLNIFFSFLLQHKIFDIQITDLWSVNSSNTRTNRTWLWNFTAIPKPYPFLSQMKITKTHLQIQYSLQNFCEFKNHPYIFKLSISTPMLDPKLPYWPNSFSLWLFRSLVFLFRSRHPSPSPRSFYAFKF